MNTYYIGGMPVTDELYHHGILGQKWYVRRFQNPDGTLTPAGKKRYYGISESTDTGGSGGTSRAHYKVNGAESGSAYTKSEQKKLVKIAQMDGTDSYDKLRTLPQIQDAARDFRDLAKDYNDAAEKYDAAQDKVHNKLYDNGPIYERTLNQAVNDWVEHNPGILQNRTVDELKTWFRYDDGDQNEHGLFETYVYHNPNDPLVKDFRKCVNDEAKASHKLGDEIKKRTSEILSETPSDIHSKIAQKVMYTIRDEAKSYAKTKDDDAESISKNSKTNRFGFSSTIPRGELTEKGKQKYGDDPSLMSKGKLKRQFYRNQAYGDNKETRKVDKEMNKYFKETKDPYNGKNYLNTYKKIDQYVTDMARARLKDMGYTPNDKAVDYLRNQPWFFKTVPLSYMLPPDKQPH